jgi:isocitrate lyase
MSPVNTPKVSRGLRVLHSQPMGPTPSQEASALQTEAGMVEEWFASDRFKHTLRPYSAMDVVSLRPSSKARYGGKTLMSPNCEASNASSEKLYALLRNLHARGGYSHTFGAMDPVQVIQMAPHLSSIYVSGWQCSSTASTTNEPGPDFADYPMNTVPNKVDHLVRAQRHHDRRQHQERAEVYLKEGEAGLRKLGPPVDYMRPVVADGDTGHGGLSAVMKLMKLFVEAGAAGVHFEDQKVRSMNV